MWQHYQNLYSFFKDRFGSHTSLEADIRTFLNKQYDWTKSMVQSNPSDAYWKSVGYIVAQLDGLYDGYKLMAEKDWVGCFVRSIKIVSRCISNNVFNHV